MNHDKRESERLHISISCLAYLDPSISEVATRTYDMSEAGLCIIVPSALGMYVYNEKLVQLTLLSMHMGKPRTLNVNGVIKHIQSLGNGELRVGFQIQSEGYHDFFCYVLALNYNKHYEYTLGA